MYWLAPFVTLCLGDLILKLHTRKKKKKFSTKPYVAGTQKNINIKLMGKKTNTILRKINLIWTYVLASRQGSGETVRMCRLAHPFAAYQCEKFCLFDLILNIPSTIFQL